MIEKVIYLDAVRKPGKERSKFVKAVCGASEELREHVESMIATHEKNTGSCGGETVSLVLNRHQRDSLSNQPGAVVPLFGALDEEILETSRQEKRQGEREVLNILSIGNVLEMKISGKLTKHAYEVFAPVVTRLIQERGKLRILFQIHDFHGWTAGALWEDIKFDFSHWP